MSPEPIVNTGSSANSSLKFASTLKYSPSAIYLRLSSSSLFNIYSGCPSPNTGAVLSKYTLWPFVGFVSSSILLPYISSKSVTLNVISPSTNVVFSSILYSTWYTYLPFLSGSCAITNEDSTVYSTPLFIKINVGLCANFSLNAIYAWIVSPTVA